MQSKPYSIKEVTSLSERKAVYQLRHTVFVDEQGISAAADEYAVSTGEITLSTSTGETNHTNLDVYQWNGDGEFTEIGRWRHNMGLVMF